MNEGTIKFKDIETPTTVEGFRENLRKYYLGIGDERIYVRDFHNGVKIDDLNSLDDLYQITSEPWICPFVSWKMDDVSSFMDETGQFMSADGFFDDDKYSTVYTDQELFRENEQPRWVKIDNQIVREFYMKTLGDFSGYAYQKEEENV